jgi:hypothetical protein
VEYTFTAAALVRILAVLDAWPCPDRGTMKMIDGLVTKLELSDEDKQAVNWRPAGQGRFMFDGRVELVRELDADEAAVLLRMAGQPPAKLAWTRGDKALQGQVFEPLGGTPWL